MGGTFASLWRRHRRTFHRRQPPAIARFGVWDHIGSLQAYLDASVGPSVDVLLFFEHLLKPSLHAVREQLSAQRAQAQGLPESVLFIGTQFSILYTLVYSPAQAATPRAWCL